jgi:hypothetical protein
MRDEGGIVLIHQENLFFVDELIRDYWSRYLSLKGQKPDFSVHLYL